MSRMRKHLWIPTWSCSSSSSLFFLFCLSFFPSLRSFRLPPLFLLFFPVIFYLFLFPPLLLFLSLLLQQNLPLLLFLLLQIISSSFHPVILFSQFSTLTASSFSISSSSPVVAPYTVHPLYTFHCCTTYSLLTSSFLLSILSSDISSTFTPFSLISFSSYSSISFPSVYIFLLTLPLLFPCFMPKFVLLFFSSTLFLFCHPHFFHTLAPISYALFFSFFFSYYFSILTLKLSFCFSFFIISVASAQSPFVPCSFLMHLYDSSSLHHPPPLLWLFFLS